jgi:hypothetical protein
MMIIYDVMRNVLLLAQRMRSVWDDVGDPLVGTTYSARTALQPQLNKAVPFHRRFSGATVSLKDWIVGYESQVNHSHTITQ